MNSEAMRPRRPRILKTLSNGDKFYKRHNILAKPKAVLLDEKHNTLFVVEHEGKKPPLSMQDELSARLTAYVVAHVEKTRFRRRREIRLYIALGENTQLEICPQLDDTRRLVDQWQTHRRRDCVDFQWIPASVLAMVLAQNIYPSHSTVRRV